MKSLTRHITIVIISLLLSGCAKVDIEKYGNNTPQFDLVEYFSGVTIGWGILQNRKGELLRQFVVKIDGSLDESRNLILHEDFHWNDGEISKRIWRITPQGNRQYIGVADDVVGTAEGRSAGSALNWTYTLAIEVDGSTWDIKFDDWMFLQQDGVLLNRAEMSKFGFKVGEVTIAFQKITNPDKRDSVKYPLEGYK